MKICTTCKELYPKAEGLTHCARWVPPGEGIGNQMCNGLLKTVECLKCEDTGKVVACGEERNCPTGCQVPADPKEP